MIQNWPLVFLYTGLNELIEAAARMLNSGGGVPIFEDLEQGGLGESMTNALIDDWLTMGGIGLIMGGLFMYHISSAALLSRDTWRRRRSQWYYYFAVIVMWFLIYPASAIVVVDVPNGNSTAAGIRIAGYRQDKSDAWLGFAVSVAYHGLLVLQAWALESYFSVAWNQEPPWKRPYFWCGAWTISALLEMQSMWDYFYSSAVQAWIISGIVCGYLLALAVARHKLPEFVDRFQSWAMPASEK